MQISGHIIGGGASNAVHEPRGRNIDGSSPSGCMKSAPMPVSLLTIVMSWVACYVNTYCSLVRPIPRRRLQINIKFLFTNFSSAAFQQKLSIVEMIAAAW